MSYGLVALGALALLALSRSSAPAPGPSPDPKPKPSGPVPRPGSTPKPSPGTLPGPSPDPKPKPSGPVLLVGDEHALMLAPPLLAALGGGVVTPIAIPMTTCATWTADDGTPAWIERWAGKVAQGSPIAVAAAGITDPASHTLAIVSLGRYDGARQVDPERLRLQVRAIVAALHVRASAVAWVLPPSGPDPWGARYVIREAAPEQGVQVFDSAGYTISRAPNLEPSPEGYQEWAAALALWLRAKGLR